MIEYKSLNTKGIRYTFIIFDIFSKYLWCVPLKNKKSKTITQEISIFVTSSKREPLKIESDKGPESYNGIFQNFLKTENFEHYSRYIKKHRTIRNLLKKPVFEKGNANWISEFPSVIKQYNNTIHYSIKVTAVQSSKKSNEKVVSNNLKDNREVRKPKLNLGQSVRTADIKQVFSKGDTTNWSNKLYTIIEVNHDTIPSNRIDYLLERYKENILLPTKLTLEQNNQVMKKLNLFQ